VISPACDNAPDPLAPGPTLERIVAAAGGGAATPHREIASSPMPEPRGHPQPAAAAALQWQQEAGMSRDPSGTGTTNRTPLMSPEWAPLEHSQPHRELSLLSLQEVIVELTRSEDALRVHRWVEGHPQEPAKTIQLIDLRARQRVILHELRRRRRRRARQRQVNNEPSAPAPNPVPLPPVSMRQPVRTAGRRPGQPAGGTGAATGDASPRSR
jgi:hypothetical protein